jgi:alkylresorcinol/alkylpyrone synthase
MTRPAILGLATRVPPYRHAQMDIHDRWVANYLNSQRARAIFRAAEIETRYSVLETSEFLAGQPGTKARNALYLQTARSLARETILQALEQAELTPAEIDQFIVVSCTGFDTPGLDVMLAADLGMRPTLRRSALIGMGCQAGLTGLDRAMVESAAHPGHYSLVLAVEFGTLHFQHGGALDNMIASALFGDGLAAVVVGPVSAERGQPQLLQTMTYSDYNAQGLMGFHLSDTGFQIHLSPKVPKLLRAMIAEPVTDFLRQMGLKITDIRFWGIHPGGAKIVEYIGQALELAPEELWYAQQVLCHYGNMSSATIFFVLESIIKEGQPRPGDYALLLSFGPGLTVELCLVQWPG